MADQIGIGFIGSGTIAQVHLRSLQASQQGRAVAVYDVLADRAETTARTFNIPAVARSIDELLARQDVDAVIVCTPPFAHAEPTLAALAAGKHVLCEKPFTLDPSEAERMVAAAERAGRFLACASARNKVTPAMHQAHAIVSSGALGEVYHVRSTSLRFRGRPGHHIFPQSSWFLDKERAGGGVTMDLAVYTIDQVLWLLGNPKVLSVMAQMRQLSPEPLPDGVAQNVEDHCVIMMQCAGGKVGLVETTWVSNMDEADGLFVFGTQAGLKFDPLRKITAQRVDLPADQRPAHFGNDIYRAVIEKVIPFERAGASGPYGDVTQAFVSSLARGEQPMTAGRDALEVTRVIDAAYRSAREQRGITLG